MNQQRGLTADIDSIQITRLEVFHVANREAIVSVNNATSPRSIMAAFARNIVAL